ncbi:MAG: RluA family pseudouridine synthase [Gaiellaceae bacterium MAG52_C11]|nr:RluA family pseudouridine synthase [Candidatus Gaiellasilicea maunaloa]
MTLRFRAPEPGRLDRALAARSEVGSRALAERLIATGDVLVDGQVRSKSHRLEGGEDVVAELPAEAGPLVPEEMGLRVAFEDAHLLVVDKPAGVVVHPGTGRPRKGGDREGGTLVHGLLALDAAGGDDDDRPGIVHRLDRHTSGLLVVARSDEAHARLEELIRRREVERRYLALVRGRPRSRTGRIEAAIGRDRQDRTRHSLDTPTPRNAVTHFELVEALRDHTLLEVTLETGRTHQIRVHLEAIELRIVGDPVYGIPGELGLERQFLHAARLAFAHPFTGERIETESPLPGDLAAALERARAL